ITKSRSYIFTFAVTAFVNLDAEYELTPTMSGWNPQLLRDDGDQPRENNRITIPGGTAGVRREVRVRVTVPDGAAQETLRLDAVETSGAGRVTPGNKEVTVTVGSPPPTPEERVRISISSVSPPPAQIVGSQVQFTRGNPAGINFNASFRANGK